MRGWKPAVVFCPEGERRLTRLPTTRPRRCASSLPMSTPGGAPLHGSVQVRDAAAAQVVQHGQDVRRGLGVDTPQDDAFDASRGGQHAFRVEEGGGADDAGSGVDAPEHSRHAGEFGGFAAAHFFEVRIRRRRGERRQRTGNDDVRVRAEDFIPGCPS